MSHRFKQELFDLTDRQVYYRLIKIIQNIETSWQDKKKRQRLLSELTDFLTILKDHPESSLHWLYELSAHNYRSMNLQAFLSLMVPVERKYGLNLADPDFLVSDRDGVPTEIDRIPLTVLVENLRSTYNVGSIFRTAECLAAERVILCGYTPTPGAPKTEKTAMGTDQYMDWEYVRETEDALQDMNKRNTPVFALETVKEAPAIFDFSFPEPCALLLGNEKFGLSRNILSKVAGTVRIPMYGWKNSLNVGISFGICGYEIRRQWGRK